MTTPDPQHLQPGAAPRTGGAFRRWRRSRPFWGGLLTVLSGLEIFATTQMNPMAVSVHLGPPGFLSWLIPTILVACGLLLWSSPQQRSFYAIIATLTAVASFIYVNLGGFFLGILLGMVGGALGFAWTPSRPRPPDVVPVPDVDDEAERSEHVPVGDLFDGPATGHTAAAETVAAETTADPAEDAPRDHPVPAAAGHPDLLTDTLPQPRNPLREPVDPARAETEAIPVVRPAGQWTVEQESAAVPASAPTGAAGVAGDAPVPGSSHAGAADAAVADADGPAGESRTSTDADRPAEESRTSTDDDGTPPNPGGPLPRRSPRLFVVTLLAISLSAAGSVMVDQGHPAEAAPCRTVRPAPSAPGPVPTTAPASPAPTPSATPTPSPSAGWAGTGGSLITGIVGGVRSLFGDGQDPQATPIAPAPDAASLAAPTAAAPAPTRIVATPSVAPTGRKPAAPVPCATSKPGTPKAGQSASAVVPKLAADSAQPTAANTPSRLTGSSLTMTDLKYEGVVSDFPTAAGPLPVLKFSMSKAVTDDFALQVPGDPGRSLLYKSGQLTVQGTVDFYTTRFSGDVLGVKVTLTPESPLPPDGIDLTVPLSITFTDPDIQLALIGCDTLTARPTLSQTLV